MWRSSWTTRTGASAGSHAALAHGFAVRSDTADFFYKCDEFYSPADKIVLRWNDPALAIDRDCEAPVLSPRDRAGRGLAELESVLPQYEPA